MKLQFKIIGKFLGDISSRSRATVTDKVQVVIFNDPDWKGWIFDILDTKNNHSLGGIVGDLLSNIPSGLTKKDIIDILNDLFSDADLLKKLDRHADIHDDLLNN